MRCTPWSRPFFRKIKLGSRASIECFCPLQLQGSVSAMVDRRWGAVAQRLVQPRMVVKPKISCQSLARVPHAPVVSQIHLLLLDTPPQALDEHVVQGPTAAIHTDPYPAGLQPRGKLLGGKLRSLVGVKNLRLAVGEGLVQRVETKRHLHGDRDSPGQHITAEPIHHGHQVDNARVQADIRDIRAPHLIDPAHRHPAQQIGVNRPALRGLAEPRLGIDRLQTHSPQQPAHALMIDGIALAVQPGRHPANAIERCGRILFVQQPHQLHIFGACADRLIVPAPPGQAQQGALASETNLRMPRLHQLAFRLSGDTQLFFSTSPVRLSTARSAEIMPLSARPLPCSSPHGGWRTVWAPPLGALSSSG